MKPANNNRRASDRSRSAEGRRGTNGRAGGAARVEPLEARSYLAGVSFAPEVESPTGAGPYRIASGDFNGDGLADLAVTDENANTVSVLIGRGDGTFAPKVDYATGANPHGIAVGDFNGDGKPDLAVTNFDGASLSVLLNRGDGTFAAQAVYAAGDGAESVAVADFNKDLKPDLAVVDQNTNTLSVFLNAGNGTFPTRTDYATGAGPIAVAAGDITGDGRADLIVLNGTDNNDSLFKNNGGGAFVLTPDRQLGLFVGAAAGLTTGDVNGDGSLDFMIAVKTSGILNHPFVLVNNGTGTFSPSQVNAGDGGNPVLADFSGDGKPDLALSDTVNSAVHVLVNSGKALDVAGTDFSTGTNPAGIAAPDLNGDGLPDIVTANTLRNTVAVLLDTTPPPLPLAVAPDPSFAGGAGVSTPLTSADAAALADGGVAVAGAAPATAGGYDVFSLARYKSDGTLAFSGSADFGLDAQASGLFVQSNGDFLLAGAATVRGTRRLALARFTAAGAPDPTFGSKGRLLGPALPAGVTGVAVAVQADGKVLIAYRPGSAFVVTRYAVLPSGLTPDVTFGTAGQATIAAPGGAVSVARLAVQADGKVVAAGQSGSSIAVARFAADGSADATFGSGGVAVTAVPTLRDVTDVKVAADGSITAVGFLPPLTSKSTTVQPVLVRYKSDGTPDATFGTGGTLLSPSVVPGVTPAADRISPSAINAAFLCLAFDGRLFELDNFTTLRRLVGTADVAAPTAALSGKLVPVTAGARTFSFRVLYKDDHAMNAATIGNGDVVVTGPNGFTAACKLVGTAEGSAGRRVATYYFYGPGGRWDAGDDGAYHIALQPKQVADAAGHYAAAARLGSFTVALPKAAVEASPAASGASVSADDSSAFAAAPSVPVPGAWSDLARAAGTFAATTRVRNRDWDGG